MRKYLPGLALVLVLGMPSSALALFHLWRITEIYSNADGSVQFIELFTTSPNQQFLANHFISATSDGTTVTYTFPINSKAPTAGHQLLLATATFGGADCPTPDFVLPAGFFDPGAASTTVNFAGFDLVTFTGGFWDGVLSVGHDGVSTAINSPTNYDGITCSLGLGSDADGDGIPNADDPCPTTPNVVPIQDSNEDGVPDECQCGDSNADGAITSLDIAGIALCSNSVIPCDSRLVDADGDGATTALDVGGIVAAVNGLIAAEDLQCAARGL